MPPAHALREHGRSPRVKGGLPTGDGREVETALPVHIVPDSAEEHVAAEAGDKVTLRDEHTRIRVIRSRHAGPVVADVLEHRVTRRRYTGGVGLETHPLSFDERLGTEQRGPLLGDDLQARHVRVEVDGRLPVPEKRFSPTKRPGLKKQGRLDDCRSRHCGSPLRVERKNGAKRVIVRRKVFAPKTYTVWPVGNPNVMFRGMP